MFLISYTPSPHPANELCGLVGLPPDECVADDHEDEGAVHGEPVHDRDGVGLVGGRHALAGHIVTLAQSAK